MGGDPVTRQIHFNALKQVLLALGACSVFEVFFEKKTKYHENICKLMQDSCKNFNKY